MYLVDTNIVSAGAPTKVQPVPGLMAWMERNSERLYLSAITVAEVGDGIAKARREAASRGYTVLTRNMRHFRALAVPAHDPFESLPTEGG